MAASSHKPRRGIAIAQQMRKPWRVASGGKARRRSNGVSDRRGQRGARARVWPSLLQRCRWSTHGGATEPREGSLFDGGWSRQGHGPGLLGGFAYSGLRGNDRCPKGRDATRLGCAPRAQERVTRPKGGGRPNLCRKNVNALKPALLQRFRQRYLGVFKLRLALPFVAPS